jgi:hypothetical protein
MLADERIPARYAAKPSIGLMLAVTFFAYLALPVRCDAQEERKAPESQPNGAAAGTPPESASRVRRLDAVTWNPAGDELTWVVSTLDLKSEGNASASGEKQSYAIHLDRATMTFNGETRGFSEDEAVQMHALMNILSRYAIESTIWWEQGQGNKVDENGRPSSPRNEKEDSKSRPLAKTRKESEYAGAPEPTSVTSPEARSGVTNIGKSRERNAQ